MKALQKSHFRYAKCQGGDIHSGQTLNLVCVDQKCDHRGLICPVCKMQSHNECHILPVKIFLAQIRDLLTSSHNPDQLNNLGAYLRTLDSTKKQMLSLLKDQITQLAQLYKDLQIKIQSTYISLRQNILIQSTLTTKLPTLLEDLLNGNCTDSFNLQKQFSKYCQLIKYRDGKPKVTDKALSLVQHYKNLPQKIKNQMNSSMTQYRKKLQEVSQKIQKQENSAQIVEQIENSSKPVFSSTFKSSNVEMNAEKDEAWLNPDFDQGFICMEQNFSKQNYSAKIDIVNLGQDNMLMIGVGKSKDLENWGNNWATLQEKKDQLYAYVHCDGSSSKICEDEDEDYQPFFFGTGQQITVIIDYPTNVCVLKHSQLSQPFQIKLKDSTQPLKLIIGLSYDDKVRLLN